MYVYIVNGWFKAIPKTNYILEHVRFNPPVCPGSTPVCRTNAFSCVIWVHDPNNPNTLVDRPS